MDLGIVVPAKLLFLLSCPASQWRSKITLSIFAADHETDLSRWIGWDSGVCVLDIGENLLAVFLKLGDQWQVKPLVLGYNFTLASCHQQQMLYCKETRWIKPESTNSRYCYNVEMEVGLKERRKELPSRIDR